MRHAIPKGLTSLEIVLSLSVVIVLLGVIAINWEGINHERKAITIARQVITTLETVKNAYRDASDYTQLANGQVVLRELYDPSLTLKPLYNLYHAGGLRLYVHRNNTYGYSTGLPDGAGIQVTVVLQRVSDCITIVNELDTVATYIAVWGATVKAVGQPINKNNLHLRCGSYIKNVLETQDSYTLAAMVL